MLYDITEEKIESYLNEIISETFLEEDYNKKLLNEKYKDCFNAIIFNGRSWSSEQNLYSHLEAFQEIDNLVYIIATHVISYFSNKNINVKDYTDCFETYRCYIEYDNNIFEIEKAYGQGSFARITLLNDDINYDNNKCAKIEIVIDWINNTDEWRMFRKK